MAYHGLSLLFIYWVVMSRRQVLDVVEALNPETSKWRRLPAMPTPRCGCCACAVGHHLVVLGGQLADVTVLDKATAPRPRPHRPPGGAPRRPRHALALPTGPAFAAQRRWRRRPRRQGLPAGRPRCQRPHCARGGPPGPSGSLEPITATLCSWKTNENHRKTMENE